MRGDSPRQRLWSTPPAAWRDPAETQAAEPHQCAGIGTTNLTLSSAESHPRDRFGRGNGPVFILMKNGEWLVPEGERAGGSSG